MANARSAGINADLGKIKKTGIYRDAETGHALYLVEGEDTAQAILDRYRYDGDGTKAQVDRRASERNYFTGEVRSEPPLQNKADKGPDANKAQTGAESTKADSDLAADKADGAGGAGV